VFRYELTREPGLTPARPSMAARGSLPDVAVRVKDGDERRPLAVPNVLSTFWFVSYAE
jgi:hypothetical protein